MTLALPLLALLTAAPAVDAGAEPSLSFADVQVNDFVAYEVDQKATVVLQVCAKNPKTVTLALTVVPKKLLPGCGLALEGQRFEVPLERLSPAPELPQPKGVSGTTLKNKYYSDCGIWESERGMHTPMHRTTRCITRELVLGGGLVSYSFSLFTDRGRSEAHDTQLVDFGTAKAGCGAWPLVPLDGWWRQSAFTPETKSVSEVTWLAKSAWVRTTGQEFAPAKGGATTIDGVAFGASGKPDIDQDYLIDSIVSQVRDLPNEGKCTPRSVKVGGASVAGVESVEASEDRWGTRYSHITVWPAAGALETAPLWVRIRPLLEEWVTIDEGGKHVSRNRLEAWRPKK